MGLIAGILLVLAAFVAESWAIWQLWQSAGAAPTALLDELAAFQLWDVLPLHVLSALLGSVGLWVMLPQRVRRPPFAAPLFLFCLCFALPLFGVVGLALVLVPALRHPERALRSDWRVIRVPDLPYKPLASQAEQYGPGGLLGVLRNAPDSERRLRAVISARQMQQRAAIPILREALQDPVDDVRLLAYALLDDKHEVLTAKIRDLLTALESGEGERVALQQSAAAAYWELAYLGLAEPELRRSMLKSAEGHLLEALTEHGRNGELLFLLGRVRLLDGRRDAAEASLQQAIEAGMSRNEVLPYLAEIAFLRHDFDQIGKVLSGIDPVKLRDQRLAPVADYWL